MTWSGRAFAAVWALCWAAACASPAGVQTTGLAHVGAAHLDAFAIPGTFAARELDKIAREREAALLDIARRLAVPPPDGVVLVLYPDEETKYRATGHRGLGRGEGRTIIEVHNESLRLDPIHELTHIVAAGLGHPPALLDEGLAVYLAEQFGADALALLGRPGQPIRETGCELVRSGAALPLERLLDFAELGSPETQGPVSYPQSASVTEYLVTTHGLDRFREAFERLRPPRSDATRRTNRRTIAQIYGAPLAEIERGWRRWVCRSSDRSPHPERNPRP